MKDDKKRSILFSSSITIMFTLAFTFASIELPRLFNNFLSNIFPDIHPYIEPDLIEEFLKKVRPFGYASFLIIFLLILVGFLTTNKILSKLGAFAVFLPVFGSFASQMFFLAGIGILRVLWLPLFDSSAKLMKLGDIAYLPYMILVYPFSLLGLDIRLETAYIAIWIGIALFLFSTFTWIQSKFHKINVVEFWVYKYSRHPQYLGYIIWSYGVMLIATLYPVPRGGINPGPSLPWLISALIIVCISIKEEITMVNFDIAYTTYRKNTPFMLPIPKFLSDKLSAHREFLFKNGQMVNLKILLLFVFYLIFLILLSLPFYLLDYPPGLGWMTWPM
jgi:hypothetical protein